MALHELPFESAGAPLEEARAVVILVHGRGASAMNILTLADSFDRTDIAYLAPQASGGTWYPHSFLVPLPLNEPALSDALAAMGRTCAVATNAGIDPTRIVLMGFSQGACLSLEFAARNPRRYGGVVAFSGGLIGNGQIPGVDPPVDKRFDYTGWLDSTPVFLGCSDVDPHIPLQRVLDSADVLEKLGGDVTRRVYRGMAHTINDDEIAFADSMLNTVGAG